MTTKTTTRAETGEQLRAAIGRLDDCDVAAVVALGIERLTKRQAWTVTDARARALVTVAKMLGALIERRQA